LSRFWGNSIWWIWFVWSKNQILKCHRLFICFGMWRHRIGKIVRQ
jgi:hypothetical protein